MPWSHDLDPTTAPYEVIMADAKKAGPWANMTPEERSAEMKRRRKVAKLNGKKRRYTRRSKDNAKGEAKEDRSSSLDHHTSYIFGKVETIIEYYARSNGVPYSALADGVAGLLRHSESR